MCIRDSAFESMYILAKGKPKTVHILKDKPNKWAGTKTWGCLTKREVDGTLTPKGRKTIQKFGARTNAVSYTHLGLAFRQFEYSLPAGTDSFQALFPTLFHEEDQAFAKQWLSEPEGQKLIELFRDDESEAQ